MLFNIFSMTISGGAIITALFHQHYLGMEPCAWCVLQRFVFVLIFLIASANLFVKSLWLDLLAFMTGVSGIGIALYQLNVANLSNSCGISAAEKFMTWTQLNTLLPQVFESYALCADANVDLFGIPYAGWSLWLFALISLTISIQIIKRET